MRSNTSTGVEWRPCTRVCRYRFPKSLRTCWYTSSSSSKRSSRLPHGVDPLGHLRHACKDIFLGVAIDQHARTPPCTCFFFYPYSIIFLSRCSHGHLSLPDHCPLKPLHMPHFAPPTSTRGRTKRPEKPFSIIVFPS